MSNQVQKLYKNSPAEVILVPIILMSLFAFWWVNSYKPAQTLIDQCVGQYCRFEGVPIGLLAFSIIFSMFLIVVFLSSNKDKDALCQVMNIRSRVAITPLRFFYSFVLIKIIACFYLTTSILN